MENMKIADFDVSLFNNKVAAMPDPLESSPLGRLGKLPRELRDQVYRWYLANGEGQFVYRHWERLPSGARRELDNSRRRWAAIQCKCPFSILESSSVLRQEALCALRTWIHFCFDDESPFFENKRDDIPYFDFISNVGFSYVIADEFDYGDYWHTSKEDSDLLACTPAGRLSLFTGNDTLRNICEIVLYNSGPNMTRLVDSPLGKTISQLTGFKTVRLWFNDEIVYSGPEVVGDSAKKRFADLTTKLASVFETTLGPSIMGEISTVGLRDATFHPQTFLASKSSENV